MEIFNFCDKFAKPANNRISTYLTAAMGKILFLES